MLFTKLLVVVVIATLDRQKKPQIQNKRTQTRTFSKHLIKNLDHQIDFNNVNILALSDKWHKLLIKETLLIQNQKPLLNIDQSLILLYLFNT